MNDNIKQKPNGNLAVMLTLNVLIQILHKGSWVFFFVVSFKYSNNFIEMSGYECVRIDCLLTAIFELSFGIRILF